MRRPRRVVSLVPSVTEAVAASDPALLVGITDYCTHPGSLDAETVGGSKYPALDRVLALAPDLVLANVEENRESDVRSLRAAGVPVWVSPAAADVPEALHALRVLLREALGCQPPGWLTEAERLWGRPCTAVRARAVVPVWRKPWVVLGRDTFAGDVLRRLGIENVYAQHEQRYPRPPIAELREQFRSGAADLLVLPSEPYFFTGTDGPDWFPGVNYALLDGRLLTWWGPSLVAAARRLPAQLGR